MIKRVFLSFAAVLAVFPICAADTNAVPDFKEVSELIRAQLPGVTEAQLNQAALDGVLTGLHGKVALAGAGRSADTNAPAVTKTMMLDDGVGYVRVARVTQGLAKEITAATGQLSASNKLKGVVLDLRFAEGEDYAAAAEVADLFVAKPRPLLNWGGGMVEAKVNRDAITLPLAMLVNAETTGAAEALVGVLREVEAGLVLGSRTAGRAMVMREFALKDGLRLRIASAPVQLGDGSVLSAEGLKPDIAVEVRAADEQVYYADAFAEVAKTNGVVSAGISSTNLPSGTNRPARFRMSEAELVRRHREGLDEDGDPSSTQEAGATQPVLRDPALARAVDLLKGLAFIRASRDQ